MPKKPTVSEEMFDERYHSLIEKIEKIGNMIGENVSRDALVSRLSKVHASLKIMNPCSGLHFGLTQLSAISYSGSDKRISLFASHKEREELIQDRMSRKKKYRFSHIPTAYVPLVVEDKKLFHELCDVYDEMVVLMKQFNQLRMQHWKYDYSPGLVQDVDVDKILEKFTSKLSDNTPNVALEDIDRFDFFIGKFNVTNTVINIDNEFPSGIRPDQSNRKSIFNNAMLVLIEDHKIDKNVGAAVTQWISDNGGQHLLNSVPFMMAESVFQSEGDVGLVSASKGISFKKNSIHWDVDESGRFVCDAECHCSCMSTADEKGHRQMLISKNGEIVKMTDEDFDSYIKGGGEVKESLLTYKMKLVLEYKDGKVVPKVEAFHIDCRLPELQVKSYVDYFSVVSNNQTSPTLSRSASAPTLSGRG